MPRALVVGAPIEHSLSPLIHTAAYRATGLENWSYGRAHVTAEQLPAFVGGLGDDVRGISVTMPCKEAALSYATSASTLATQVGAANTLVRAGEGWHAENTDVAGIIGALHDAGYAGGTDALVLGSGATARSLVMALAELGVRHVTFVVRAAARSQTLDLARALALGVSVSREDDELTRQIEAASLIVSTGPPHAADSVAMRVAAHLDGRREDPLHVLDVVYAGWPTRLAQVTGERGARVVSGLEMLVHQAAVQFELFTGQRAPIADMMRAGHDAVK